MGNDYSINNYINWIKKGQTKMTKILSSTIVTFFWLLATLVAAIIIIVFSLPLIPLWVTAFVLGSLGAYTGKFISNKILREQ